LASRPRTGAARAGIIAAMNTPNARSRFLLLPAVEEASAVAKAPVVLRRYSLARLAASAAPSRLEQRSLEPQPQH
jgi:hypothetical protein